MVSFAQTIVNGRVGEDAAIVDVHTGYEYELPAVEYEEEIAEESFTPTPPAQNPPTPSPQTAPPTPPAQTPPTQNQNEDWRLKLVNAQNLLPANFSPPLATLPNGLQFDSRAIGQLNAMLAAMRNQGLSPVVSSAHRSIARQTELFNNRVTQLRGTGLTQQQAEQEAARRIARPGTSEHNLGLAVDIVDLTYQNLTDNQANTPVGQWLYRNSADFGFILRYGRGTEHITGIVFEPWHFRYVGVEAAREITSRGITLEEFLS